jgi:hypothetical protein
MAILLTPTHVDELLKYHHLVWNQKHTMLKIKKEIKESRIVSS